jgi:NAD+ synthase (glutamine-hydrolysing)
MRATYQEKVILGLSGGLDSTLALLVALEAAKILHKQPGSMIETLTMPGFASSDMTQHNAQTLANSLGVPNRVFPINELAEAELKLLEHSGEQDITYENVQARARTSLLFNYANLHGGMVLGTGDLSEIALGWSTYNADQQSHYNVNASIPKTMVKHLVAYLAEQPDYLVARQTLAAIIETPISPELTSHHDDKISQTTEDIIGPYELHDFFLYSLIRWGDTRSKIEYLANQAFADVYQPAEINKWLGVFLNRFARSQFKRETMPNGPKVGSVSLSPRGDWRMPSDLHNAALWE